MDLRLQFGAYFRRVTGRRGRTNGIVLRRSGGGCHGPDELRGFHEVRLPRKPQEQLHHSQSGIPVRRRCRSRDDEYNTMKTTFKIPLVCLIATTLFACSPRQPEEQNATDETQETERLEDVGELPELSVYNLPSTWQTQEGDTLLLEDLRGKVVVVVMIYTSCQAACPRLVA